MFFISHSDKRHDKSPKFICSPVIHQEMRFAAPGRSLQQQHTGSALSKELSLAGRNRILKSKTENKVSLRSPEKQIEQSNERTQHMRVVSFGFSWKCPDLAYVTVKDTNTFYINVASPCSLALGPTPVTTPAQAHAV